MSQFTRVHGDLQPVMNLDASGYTVGAVNAVTDGAVVQPQGPKLEYFTVTFDGSVAGSVVNTAVQTLQQLSTVYIYQYNAGADDTLAVAVYPVSAWTASAIDTALASAGVAGTSTATGASFA